MGFPLDAVYMFFSWQLRKSFPEEKTQNDKIKKFKQSRKKGEFSLSFEWLDPENGLDSWMGFSILITIKVFLIYGCYLNPSYPPHPFTGDRG